MAIIKIRNPAIDLDAAEIPNLDASKITSGSFADARIPNLATSKITSGTFADARIAASNVSQHATSFDDNKIVNDISTLGLRVHTQENLNASNTNSASFDVFQDSSGITNLTNTARDNGEFISSITTANDTTVMDVVNADALTTGAVGSQVAYGIRGDTKIVSQGDGGLSINDDHPFSTGKSWQTNSWADSSADSGFWIKDHTGGSNQTGWANFGTGAFTIECWIKLNTIAAGSKTIFDMRSGATELAPYLYVDGANIKYFNNGSVTITGATNLVVGTWYHVAISRSGTDTKLFLNGTQEGSTYSDSSDSVSYTHLTLPTNREV